MLSIYDATGRIVFKSQLGSNSEIIDIAQFPDGIYIVTLRQNEKVYSRKISF
ncbi:MAG: T9SS type A sorting domain-containing protein [Bacteroidetes bacterium]|nr:T9SS type A sorting domain-containing protein [Bacteroidota bacterium]